MGSSSYSWLTKQASNRIVLVAVIVCVTAIAITLIVRGLDDRSTPLIVTILTALTTVTAASVSATKATEAADTASKIDITTKDTHAITEFSASKLAAIQQLHDVDLQCPMGPACPLGLHMTDTPK